LNLAHRDESAVVNSFVSGHDSGLRNYSGYKAQGQKHSIAAKTAMTANFNAFIIGRPALNAK
jgi:hypothetical protein